TKQEDDREMSERMAKAWVHVALADEDVAYVTAVPRALWGFGRRIAATSPLHPTKTMRIDGDDRVIGPEKLHRPPHTQVTADEVPIEEVQGRPNDATGMESQEP